MDCSLVFREARTGHSCEQRELLWRVSSTPPGFGARYGPFPVAENGLRPDIPEAAAAGSVGWESQIQTQRATIKKGRCHTGIVACPQENERPVSRPDHGEEMGGRMPSFCSITAATASTGKKTGCPIVILLARRALTRGVSWQRQDENANRVLFCCDAVRLRHRGSSAASRTGRRCVWELLEVLRNCADFRHFSACNILRFFL